MNWLHRIWVALLFIAPLGACSGRNVTERSAATGKSDTESGDSGDVTKQEVDAHRFSTAPVSVDGVNLLATVKNLAAPECTRSFSRLVCRMQVVESGKIVRAKGIAKDTAFLWDLNGADANGSSDNGVTLSYSVTSGAERDSSFDVTVSLRNSLTAEVATKQAQVGPILDDIVMFMTAGVYSGNLKNNLPTGFGGADYKCASSVDSSAFFGSKAAQYTWIALLGSRQETLSARFSNVGRTSNIRGDSVTLSGKTLLQSLDLPNPYVVAVSEEGLDINRNVDIWSGPFGTSEVSSMSEGDCNGWTVNDSSLGLFGGANVPHNWLRAVISPANCGDFKHLYCLGFPK